MLWRLILLTTASVLLSGCASFGVKPMPQRLCEEEQKRYEFGWDHLVALGPQVEHTALLDTILVGRAWHEGVDKLVLHSEKRVGEIRVVMETQFDRSSPEDDIFSVAFYDAQGRILRQDRFTPAEIDDAVALYLTPDGQVENETPAEREQRLARLAERAGRLQRVEEVFPTPPEFNEATAP